MNIKAKNKDANSPRVDTAKLFRSLHEPKASPNAIIDELEAHKHLLQLPLPEGSEAVLKKIWQSLPKSAKKRRRRMLDTFRTSLDSQRNE